MKEMKKRFINRRAVIILLFVVSGMFIVWGMNFMVSKPQLSRELKSLEREAEKGDTVALHKLLNFYDENSEIIIEIVEARDAYGNEIEINEISEEPFDSNLNELYLERLNYWLNKGLAINDPVAKRITGMRLYYEDETKAIQYLAELAEKGDRQAALFCGSACYNQDRGQEAFKYLNLAYEMGEPSA